MAAPTRLTTDLGGSAEGAFESGTRKAINANFQAVDGILPTATPASAGATGTAGQVCWDANYVYVCVSANTWKRAAIATW